MAGKLSKEQIAKDKILEAALAVIYENTISGTRMHLIADKTDTVQSNIHYYYKTKELLLEDLHWKISQKGFEIRDEITSSHRVERQDELEGQLEIFILQKLDFILEEPQYDLVEMDFWLQAHVKPNIRKQMSQGFAAWRDALGEMIQRFAPDMDENYRHFLTYMIVSLLEGATIQYHIDPEGFDVKEYFARCKVLIINLIRGNGTADN